MTTDGVDDRQKAMQHRGAQRGPNIDHALKIRLSRGASMRTPMGALEGASKARTPTRCGAIAFRPNSPQTGVKAVPRSQVAASAPPLLRPFSSDLLGVASSHLYEVDCLGCSVNRKPPCLGQLGISALENRQ